MKELLKQIFGSKKNIENTIESHFHESKSIEEFKKLGSEARFKNIMILGDTGQAEYLDLLKYCISNDPDADVKFAALKRIHLFEKSEVINFLTQLQDSAIVSELEPYFSMALSRTGIISIEEFENRINGGQ